MIDGLVKTIVDNGGEIIFNTEVVNFILDGKTVTGVEAMDLITHQTSKFTADTVICNIDPKKAAKMIGYENYSPKVLTKLNYEYSPSNYMAYCVVKDIDLRDYGFGKWNTFHTGHRNLNEAFEQMYVSHDYSNPSFAITTPTLLTTEERVCPEDCQIIEFLTVADYSYFQELKTQDDKANRQ